MSRKEEISPKSYLILALPPLTLKKLGESIDEITKLLSNNY